MAAEAAAGSGASRSGGSLEATSRAIGRASLPSCRRIDDAEPGGARRVDEGVDPASRRKHQRAVARGERFGRLAVEGHDADILSLYFDPQ